MAGSKEFVVHILDRLQPLGAVTARAMFGGHGIYCDGVMFALIAEDVLYFKVDDQNRPRFEALGAGPFRPYADRPMTMSYYEAPAEVFDDDDALTEWARAAFEAALRARRAQPVRRRTRRGA